MKKTRKAGLILLALILGNLCHAQSLSETKSFLFEKIRANSPLPNEQNEVYYDATISKADAEKIGKRSISDDHFPYLLICGYTHTIESMNKWGWTIYNIFDIRDIKSISVNKRTGKYNFYTITLRFSPGFATKMKDSFSQSEPSNELVSDVVIGLSDNPEAVEKIKKAFIHFGTLVGATIQDKDVF